MKKIKSYDDFLNEAYYGDYMKVVKKVYTIKNSYDKYDVEDKQSNLAWSLRNAKIDTNITLSKLVKDPKFDELPDGVKNDILAAAGTGRTPNRQLVKEFTEAFRNFGDDYKDAKSNNADPRSKEEAVRLAASYITLIENDDDDEIIYSLWFGLASKDRRVLNKNYTITKVMKTFTDVEKAHILKFGLPKMSQFARSWWTDWNIRELIEYKTDFYNVADRPGGNGTNLGQLAWVQPPMAKPFAFIKEIILKGDDVKWDKIDVKEIKMLGSEHSAVVSSSFSTTYFYTATFKINGKTFKIPKVSGGSDHYSGGWN